MLNEWLLTGPEDVLGFFLQIVTVSLCSLVLLMRMARDRKRAMRGPDQEEERLFQIDEITEGETARRFLYRDNEDGAHI